MELTACEEKLLADAAAGSQLDPMAGESIDVSVGAQWGPERTVRAEVLEGLVTGALATLHHRGVHIRGVKVQGALRLSSLELTQPLSLIECYFDGPVVVGSAKLKDLVLTGSRAMALDLSGAIIEGNVLLDQGFSATGEVSLVGAEISGQLGCEGGSFRNKGGHAINAERVLVKSGMLLDKGFSAIGEVRLVGAEISGQLSCRGGKFRNHGGHAIHAQGVVVKSSVLLNHGFSAMGQVSLVGAEISGQLSCRGGRFRNKGGYAIDAERVRAKSGMLLDKGFSAIGEVRLVDAEISDRLSCEGGRFRNDGGCAINAEGVAVTGSVSLNHHFSATGEVRLPGAEISGQLNCRGGRFRNQGGYAIHAEGVVVKRSLLLSHGFSAIGEVRLVGTEISGQLSCRGGSFRNQGGYAIHAEGVVVKRSLLLSHGFSAIGEVGLLGAEISGQLSCRGGSFSNQGGYAIYAEGATVKLRVLLDGGISVRGEVAFLRSHLGGLSWNDQDVQGILDLRDAEVPHLADRWVQPLKQGARVRLNGFRYESFVEGTDDSLELRLAWLRSSPGYTPQLYTQLAAVYRRSGHDDRARKVLIAREVDRRKRGQPSPWAKAKSLLLGATVAHGYEPARAALFLVVLWMIGVALLLGAPGRQAMVPTKTTAVTQPPPSSAPGQQPTALSCPPRYPCFNPWIYSAETVVPLIELEQTANWQPAGGASRYQIWVWGATGLGWFFTTLGVAGVTGVIRRD